MPNELYPSVGFEKSVLKAAEDKELSVQTFTYTSSGDFTSGVSGSLMGAVAHANGKITDVVLSAGDQGRDDVDDLELSGDVKVNGSSVVDTNPTITGVSGETSTAQVANKPTFSDPSVSRGDRISLDLNLTRTTPDTEMQDIHATVKILVTE